MTEEVKQNIKVKSVRVDKAKNDTQKIVNIIGMTLDYEHYFPRLTIQTSEGLIHTFNVNKIIGYTTEVDVAE